MSRIITVAAAALGPIQKAEPRSSSVARMVRLLERAHKPGVELARRGIGAACNWPGVELVVFPELPLTTFFPRHYHADATEANSWFETTMPSNETAPLFDAARRYGIGFHLGYAEIVHEADETGIARQRRFNTSILVGPQGDVLLKYRRVHLPGHAESDPKRVVQHLEKRYFEVGNLGLPVIRAPLGGLDGINMGMMICNDRRWPEAWRVLGLQSVELVATAKAGIEDGAELFGHSIIVNPQDEIVAMASSWDNELITADCDLDMCMLGRTPIFAFDKHRRPEAYACPVVSQARCVHAVVGRMAGTSTGAAIGDNTLTHARSLR